MPNPVIEERLFSRASQRSLSNEPKSPKAEITLKEIQQTQIDNESLRRVKARLEAERDMNEIPDRRSSHDEPRGPPRRQSNDRNQRQRMRSDKRRRTPNEYTPKDRNTAPRYPQPQYSSNQMHQMMQHQQRLPPPVPVYIPNGSSAVAPAYLGRNFPHPNQLAQIQQHLQLQQSFNNGVRTLPPELSHLAYHPDSKKRRNPAPPGFHKNKRDPAQNSIKRKPPLPQGPYHIITEGNYSGLHSPFSGPHGQVFRKNNLRFQTSPDEIAVEPVHTPPPAAPQPAFMNEQDPQVDRVRKPLDVSFLPVYAKKDEFFHALHNSQVILVSGTAGAGKSTQIPKWLLESEFCEGKQEIVCVQPRRIAAISLATRVCEELDEDLGVKVGFKVRFEEVTSPATKLRFVTDGILMFESVADKLLNRYSVVILDEAHERSMFNDLLFGICRGVQKRRPKFKVIVMSATLDIEQFINYFPPDITKILTIDVRQYKVRQFFRETPLKKRTKPETYIHEVFEILKVIEKESREGDVLVFLPGASDINTLVGRCENRFRRNWYAMPLYASMDDREQQKIYRPPPKGKRKVIFATNIAETSITVPGVIYVIDTGLEKRSTWDPVAKANTLVTDDISQTSARQRMGRAGRLKPGVVYCLYTRKELERFRMKQTANMLSQRLDMICLLLLHLGFTSVDDFPWLERPTDSHLKHSMNQLLSLKAVKDIDGSFKITNLGRQMARFPLQPHMSKAIVIAKEYKVLDWMISVVAMLDSGGHGVFTRPKQFKKQADQAKGRLKNLLGDQFTLADLLHYFVENEESEDWCRENFLRFRVLSEAAKVRNELQNITRQLGWKGKADEDQYGNSRTQLCAWVRAFSDNMGYLVNVNKGWPTYNLANGTQAILHPGSALAQSNKKKNYKFPEFVSYYEQYSTAQTWISIVCKIPKEIYVKEYGEPPKAKENPQDDQQRKPPARHRIVSNPTSSNTTKAKTTGESRAHLQAMHKHTRPAIPVEIVSLTPPIVEDDDSPGVE